MVSIYPASILLRSPAAPSRLYPPETIAAVRALIEIAGLTRREAAAQSGLREGTIGNWARRYGWRRAGGRGAGAAALVGSGPASEGPFGDAGLPHLRHAEEASQTPSRSTQDRGACFETARGAPPQHDEVGGSGRGARDGARGRLGPGAGRSRERGCPYGPELREAARARVEGSRDGMERIAIELGIQRGSLYRWAKRFGWRRPAAPERGGMAGAGFFRSRRFGRAYGGDAVGTARDLVTGSTMPLGRIAARVGVSRVTLYRWMTRRGWVRPVAPGRRRYRPPYGPDVVAAVRALYETTELSTKRIAARTKTTPERVWHWARTGGWIRLRDLPYPCAGLDPRHWPDPHGRVRRPPRPRASR